VLKEQNAKKLGEIVNSWLFIFVINSGSPKYLRDSLADIRNIEVILIKNRDLNKKYASLLAHPM